jgi:hypothetical protein
MRRRPIQILTIVLSLALVLSVAGCGKKKNAATTTTTAAAATTAAATSTEAATTAAAATTEPTTTAASGLGALASSGNCQELLGLGQALSSAFSGADSTDIKKQAELMKEFADKAPSDIKGDLEVFADFFSKVADLYPNGYKPGTTPDAATLAKLAQLSSSIDSAKLTAAAQHISTWAGANCHG